MGRRIAGEGNIRQRPDGRWEGRFDITSFGKRRRVSVYGRTAEEARRKLKEAMGRAEKGWSGDPQRTTVADFLRSWLELTKDKRRPNTNESYRLAIENHLIPHLGKARLVKLTPLHVDKALSEMSAVGAGPRTRQLARAVLRAALNDAIRWGLAERNSAELSSPVSYVAEERHPLTKEQLGALGELLADDPLEAAFLFLATTGARRGESVGLRWEYLDLDGANAKIRHSLQRVKKTGLVAFDPKTERGKRPVALAPIVVDALRRRRDAQALDRVAAGDSWLETGFVFTTPIGTPVDPMVLTHRWEEIRTEIGAPEAVLNTLRHTVASYGIQVSSDIMAVSRLLGHSRMSTTTDIYGHLVQDSGRDVVSVMGGLLDPVGKASRAEGDVRPPDS